MNDIQDSLSRLVNLTLQFYRNGESSLRDMSFQGAIAAEWTISSSGDRIDLE
ncbi:MAG: hypothetical protein AAGA60_32335 [Cyanobacteria bacterium P01_E01_bin.42]